MRRGREFISEMLISHCCVVLCDEYYQALHIFMHSSDEKVNANYVIKLEINVQPPQHSTRINNLFVEVNNLDSLWIVF